MERDQLQPNKPRLYIQRLGLAGSAPTFLWTGVPPFGGHVWNFGWVQAFSIHDTLPQYCAKYRRVLKRGGVG